VHNCVTSGSDPRGTRNADNDGGPSGPRRRGLELVRQSETQMSEQTSKQSWMTRVQMVTRTRTEVRMGSEDGGQTGSEDGGLNGVRRRGLGLVR
jgi:hypothetical protein